jgi:hypothetical protein
VLLEPSFDRWEALARDNAAAAALWNFEVAGTDARELRSLARAEALVSAQQYCARLGIPARRVDGVPDLVVVTGHQPELYHPGVWAKDFLLQLFADQTGAVAIDVVVDSDGFDAVGIRTPCMRPDPALCSVDLSVGTKDGCFACAEAPTIEAIREFGRAGADALATLPSDVPLRNFERFRADLEAAAPVARNLAELVTLARRRYESAAGTDYLELPITTIARSRAFASFVAHIALDARRFAGAYNLALAEYRRRTGTRSAAQPFPDLAIEADAVELPLWVVGATRHTVWVSTSGEPALVADGRVLCELGADPATAAETLVASSVALAPKALALTLFTRMFVADLFIHGVGGGRYDQVTDDVVNRYFGVDAPSFMVASATMLLPLGIPVVADAEIEEASMALNRLEHNPDQLLGGMSFDSAADADRAAALVAEKGTLVEEITRPDADKKATGARIRAVNAELATLLEPVRLELTERVARLEQSRDARDILIDRTYPFCLWDPAEMAGTVGRAALSRVSR